MGSEMRDRKDLDELKHEMEELFADLCQVPRLVRRRHGFRPLVDVYRTDDPPSITIVAELAGVEPADLEVAVADGVLQIAGKRRREHGEPRVYHQIEIDYGPFRRRIQLAEPVDTDRAEATYVRGVLRVVLPVTARPQRPVRVLIATKGSA